MNIEKIPSKMKQEVGEIILHFSDIQHTMTIAYVISSFIRDDVMPLAEMLPKTRKAFNELKEFLSSPEVMSAVMEEVFEESNNKFYEVYNEFKKIDKFKPMLGDIQKLKNFRNRLAHSKCVTMPGARYFILGYYKDGKLKREKVDTEKLSEYRILAKKIMKRLREFTTASGQKEEILKQLD